MYVCMFLSKGIHSSLSQHGICSGFVWAWTVIHTFMYISVCVCVCVCVCDV